jgi:hypothetical protein
MKVAVIGFPIRDPINNLILVTTGNNRDHDVVVIQQGVVSHQNVTVPEPEVNLRILVPPVTVVVYARPADTVGLYASRKRITTYPEPPL